MAEEKGRIKTPRILTMQLEKDAFDYTLSPEEFELADQSEKESFIQTRPPTTYWQDAWRRLKLNKIAMAAMVILVLLVVFAFIGPAFIPYSYSDQVRGSENLAPMAYSAKELALKAEGQSVFPHVLGTDSLGRDNLVRAMYGTRTSMIIGIVCSIIVLVIGSIYGAIAGYCGGAVDNIMMRIVDIIYTVPDTLVVIILSISLRPVMVAYMDSHDNFIEGTMRSLGVNIFAIFIAFALLYWVTMARIVRGQVLQIKQQDFILAAEASGARNGRIIFRHLLPNCIGAIVSAVCLQIPTAIFLESFLSYLGLGVEAPMVSLGSLASDALQGMYTYTYRLVIPSVLLLLLILSLNLLGDGLRDALDPRMKS